MIGTTLSHYRILEKLGQGGMGVVYRAHDTTLDRQAAIKVLPDIFSGDPERLARFEREAKLLASLNHNNIAAIYGLEQDQGKRFLVLELVEGETLAQRIGKGPLPLDEALEVCKQIAEGLEAAHEKGIIHRDLKPANVKVTPEGKVKILDFGLAKAFHEEPSAAAVANSPTITEAMTQPGVVLGTAAYMSPEQAKGKPVDKRADIWAFGCILFECLTGKRAFQGETITETMAAVLKSDPDWKLLPPGIPSRLRDLLANSLEKDPRRRLRDIGDGLHELARAEETPPAATTGRPTYAMLIALAALVVLALGLSVALYWSLTRPLAAGETIHASITLPEGHALYSSPAISSDGRTVVFASAGLSEVPKLYYRHLMEDSEVHAIPDTEGANAPFLSPDGKSVAYFAKRQVFRTSLNGGTPIPLADAPYGTGGTWSEKDSIAFWSSGSPGLIRVAASPGSKAEILIHRDRLKAYQLPFPKFLPHVEDLLFTAAGNIGIVHFKTSSESPSIILPGFWTNAAYASSGHLVFGSISSLFKSQVLAVQGSIQTDSFNRTPVVVAQNVFAHAQLGRLCFDLSDNGTFVYAAGDVSRARPAMVDRAGQVLSTYGEHGYYEGPALSPDGKRIAYALNCRIYVRDLKGGEPLLLTTEPGSPDLWQDREPTWSWDDSRVIYASNRSGNWDIYAKDASGAGSAEPLVKKEFDQYDISVRKDGTLAFTENNPVTARDIWILKPGEQPKSWLSTPFLELKPAFSPDGRLIAYQTDRNERFEIYISPFAEPNKQIRVSTAGGTCPVWSPKGDRLYFRRGTGIMAVDIRMDGTPAGNPRQMFDGGWFLGTNGGLPLVPMNPTGFSFAVTGDEHFLMVRAEPEAVPTKINIVFNWFEELKRLVPVK